MLLDSARAKISKSPIVVEDGRSLSTSIPRAVSLAYLVLCWLSALLSPRAVALVNDELT